MPRAFSMEPMAQLAQASKSQSMLHMKLRFIANSEPWSCISLGRPRKRVLFTSSAHHVSHLRVRFETTFKKYR